MAFLDRVRNVPIMSNDYGRRGFLDTRQNLGLAGHVLDTGEHIGAAAFSGWLNAKHGDHKWMKVRGVETTLVAGWGLKALAVIADLFGFGGGLFSHVDALATGTLSAHYAAQGASAGTPDHVKSALASAGAGLPAAKKQQALGGESVGYIPPAPEPGKWLDLNRVSRIAAMNG